MIITPPGRYFDIVVPQEITKLLNINICTPEYQETQCSINDYKKIDENEDFLGTVYGTINIVREGFLIFILSYEYNIEEFTESCTLKVEESFTEMLRELYKKD